MSTTPKTPPPSTPNHVKAQSSVDAFPTPPRDDRPPLSLRIKGRMSPAPKKLMEMTRAASTPPEITRDHAFRTVSWGTPGGLPDNSNLELSWQRQQMSKKKSQYFTEAFSYRELSNTAKDRVSRDSVVIAKVRLNCHLPSEQDFLLDLSFQLAEIYQRPESSIMVMVSPCVAMILGGNSEPAYHLTITALQSDVAPTKNKRSTYLLQQFMLDTLHISGMRGVVRFEGIAEADLATGGMTIQQEIEEMEQKHSNEDTGILRAISRQGDHKGKKAAIPIFTERGKTPVPSSRAITPSHLKSHVKLSSAASEETGSTDYPRPGRKRVKHAKSIMAFFRKTD